MQRPPPPSLERERGGRDEQRRQEAGGHTWAYGGERGPVAVQELQGHAVGPAEAQLQRQTQQSVEGASAKALELRSHRAIPERRIRLRRPVCRLR